MKVILGEKDQESAVVKQQGKYWKIRLRRVPDASGPSLEGAIIDSVEPRSTIQTDGWEGYSRLAKPGYRHEVIRKEAVIGKNILPKVNRIAALLKRWLLGIYQGRVESSHIEYYLDEYTFRFNRRTSRSRGKLFYRSCNRRRLSNLCPQRIFAVMLIPGQPESSAHAYKINCHGNPGYLS